MFSVIGVKKSAFFALALGAIVASAIHVWYYVGNEQHTYAWDYRNYWIWYWQSGVRFSESVQSWLAHLRDDIWQSDYNTSSVAMLLPFSLLFGYSRSGFILGLALSYLVPVALLSAATAALIVRDRSSPTLFFLVFSAFAALYVPYWAPTLRGYPDIVGLIPLTLAFVVVKTSGFGHRFRPGYALLLGVLIWMPFLFRRWYAFSIVAFTLTAPLYSIALELAERRVSWASTLRNIVLNYAIAGMCSTALALGMQGGLINTILSTSYSDIYVAYQRPLWSHIIDFLGTFGGFYLAMALCAQFAFLKSRRIIIDVLFLNINIAVIFALFTRTQGFGLHHYLPISLWLLILSCVGLWLILSSFARLRSFAGLLICIVASAVWANSLYRGVGRPEWANFVLPGQNVSLRTGSGTGYTRLVERLHARLRSGDKFTVFASSLLLNRDALLSISYESLAGRDVEISHVDLIHGLNVGPFMARYAVVADPVQTHLPAFTQSVVTIPATAILTGNGIGAAYRRVGNGVTLARGVKAYIYEKLRPFTASEVRALLSEFYKLYPEWRKVHENAAFMIAMTSTTELGDVWGSFDYNSGGQLIIHPGETTPTRFTFPSVGRTLRLTARPACPRSDGVDVELKAGESVISQVTILPGASATLDLHGDVSNYTVTIDKRSNPLCDSVTLSEVGEE